MLTNRERTRFFGLNFGAEESYPSGSIQRPAGYYDLYSGTQFTASEGHPVNRSTGIRDSGGPFFTSRVDYSFKTANCTDAYDGKSTYSGAVYCMRPSDKQLGELGTSYESLDKETKQISYPSDSDGATAIARSSPRSPHAQLGTSLIEGSRDGLPAIHGSKLWETRVRDFRKLGDEYLNHVYGWAPFSRDVHDSAKTVSRSGAIAEQWKQREGTDTHRTYTFPQEQGDSKTIETSGYFASFPGFYNNFIYADGNTPKVTLTKETVINRWFSGSFTFAMPSSSNFWRKHEESGRKARELLGLQLNPELLWEATPWSWAVDWFSNVGDVMSNITDYQNAGQVLRYGYMMEESITKYTISQDEIHLRHKPPFTGETEKLNYHLGPISTSVIITTKRRSVANPFGFGLEWEGLSPTQLAITAALGISRL